MKVWKTNIDPIKINYFSYLAVETSNYLLYKQVQNSEGIFNHINITSAAKNHEKVFGVYEVYYNNPQVSKSFIVSNIQEKEWYWGDEFMSIIKNGGFLGVRENIILKDKYINYCVFYENLLKIL